MRFHLITTAIVSLFIVSCKSNSEVPKTTENETVTIDSSKDETIVVADPHSYARPNEAKVNHLNLTLDIDFESRTLSGVAHWEIYQAENAKQIVFDTKALQIEKVWLNENEDAAYYSVGDFDETFGSPLTIELEENTKSVSIQYKTTPGAEALMWLEPSQTQGKKHPFFFTQSQAILARTWIPCQDGPGVRYTYEATVTTPDGLLAAMSASNPTEKSEDNTYNFKMSQPVPSYLMALVCGDLEFRGIGDRTGVYAEPALIEAAEYELGEMQTMLEKAEGLYGQYAWERYDVVFLPPSFPFGGMENPRLTFATPTIIAGDRSLTALIAHELAHSWSGNLVTNATWNDFWLNEGFTVYFEQRIMEEVYGREYSEMLALLSFQGLLGELEDFEADNAMEDTHLKLDLEGRNPDDGLSAIAYDKGYLFLRMLEESYGRETFDNFLKNYFETNAFKVMTTERFINYLQENLLSKDESIAESCKIEDWIYGPGLPDNCPNIKSSKLTKLDDYIASYFESADMAIEQIDTTGWTAHEYIYFAANIPKTTDSDALKIVDNYFDFTNSTNNEILGKWYQLAAHSNYQDAYGAMENFLINVGRRKFLTPIYRELVTTKAGWSLANDIYTKAKPNYHAVARNTIEDLLEETAPNKVTDKTETNG
ncbi:MAG: M1 family metallopeptidase [Bacteroidia bacterium]